MNAIAATGIGPLVTLEPSGVTYWGPILLGWPTEDWNEYSIGLTIGTSTTITGAFTGVIIGGSLAHGGLVGLAIASPAWLSTGSITVFLYYRTYLWFLTQPEANLSWF